VVIEESSECVGVPAPGASQQVCADRIGVIHSVRYPLPSGTSPAHATMSVEIAAGILQF
jgi:hypothetical protein